MALQRQHWSINALSVELGLDRRTLAKRLDGLNPAQVDPKLYELRAVLDHLRQYQQLPDLDEILDEDAFRDVVLLTVVSSLHSALWSQLPKTLRAVGGSNTEQITRQVDAIMLAYRYLAYNLAIAVGLEGEGLREIAQLGHRKSPRKKAEAHG